MSDAVDQLAGIIPVVIMGGVAMKMTETMMNSVPSHIKSSTPKRKKKSRHTKRYTSSGFGDFSNVGL